MLINPVFPDFISLKFSSSSKHISEFMTDSMEMSGAGRFWEVDGIRGIAILMMVVFHILFDLNFFSVYAVNVSTGFWRYFGYATASLFLFIVGVSLAISHARAARSPFRRCSGKKIPAAGRRDLLPGTFDNGGHLVVPARWVHHLWYPAPDRGFRDDLTPLFPV